METRKAVLLSLYTTAVVPTGEELFTRLLHQIEAFLLSANIFKGWDHTRGWLCELISTKTTRCGYVLITSFTKMIWLRTTFDTEILLTGIASNSVHSHVLGSLQTHWLPFVIL